MCKVLQFWNVQDNHQRLDETNAYLLTRLYQYLNDIG